MSNQSSFFPILYKHFFSSLILTCFINIYSFLSKNLCEMTCMKEFFVYKKFYVFLAMSLEESRRSQRPYRYGMVLLCVGALINWLGLAENYVEPVRYVGVACIVAGALLICAAMCCWLHAPPTRTSTHTQHTNHPITAQVTIIFVYLWRDNEFIRANKIRA